MSGTFRGTGLGGVYKSYRSRQMQAKAGMDNVDCFNRHIQVSTASCQGWRCQQTTG